jgi:hypothetical protein
MVGVHRSFFEAILAGEIMVSKTTNVGYPGVEVFVFQSPAARPFSGISLLGGFQESARSPATSQESNRPAAAGRRLKN